MLDPKLVRENPEAVREATRIKHIASPDLVDNWLKADEKRRNSQLQADTLRNEQKKISDQVGQLKRQLKGGSNPEVEQLIEQSNRLKQQQQDLTDQQSLAEAEANQLMLQLPAIPDPSWPIGADANENKLVRTWSHPDLPPNPLTRDQKDHAALGVKLGILDFERGVKLAGSRSYIVKGHGALLYNAVLRFAMDV